MRQKRSTYTQILKFRWVTLGFATLVAFVLLANTNQVPISELASNTTAQTENLPATASLIKPQHFQTVLLGGDSFTSSNSNSNFTTEDASLQNDANLSIVVIQKNDTLSEILDRFGVHSALNGLLKIKKEIKDLISLRPNKLLHLEIRDHKLTSLVYEITPTDHLKVSLSDNQYVATHETLPTQKHESHAFGVIKNSFYQAAIKAGLSDKIIVEMTNILGWDIDFVLDIRRNDYFSVIYEEEYLNGEKLRDGDIQAVEFVNNGKLYRAVRYAHSDNKVDYFSPNGKSMRKPFMRNPIEYTKISSHFSLNRLHPIFKTVRPHRGVDYATPIGTPIRATGDGKIIFKGQKGGYGNIVIIKHGNNYSTLYAHMSKFARNLKVGDRVKQKSIIGYVGMTGYATGPHLHYEFRVNNAHKNPLTIKLPDSRPLAKSKMAHFRQATSLALKKLDTLKGAYASLDISPS